MKEEEEEEEVPQREIGSDEAAAVIGYIFVFFCICYTVASILVKLLPARY